MSKEAESRTVWDLKQGESSTIRSFLDIEMESQFIAVGIVPNTRLTLVSYSPLKSAVRIRLGDTYMALRNHEAKCILIN